ncbi:MAG: dihydroorotase [Saprospiraceae bacterium]|nr:dihydroorotase [Saprospiraceae bacterium]MDW8485091.1 dihydroorotase [Saprospiraceae bacterium]
MHLLFRRVRIFVEGRLTEPQDLLVREGVIMAIGPALPIPSGAKTIAFPDEVWAMPGWLDVGVQVGEPGYEHRETLHTVAQAAAAGGFTAVAPFPNTLPVADDKGGIAFIHHKTAKEPVHFYPIGALSVATAGKDLAELYDMHAAGAVAFSDGCEPLQSAGLLVRALQYTQAFGGLVLDWPLHRELAAGGQMHEGIVSTRLGLRGIPPLAEEIAVQRSLSILEYTGGRLHLHLLSSAKSVALVRAAKAAGIPVTASVAIFNLCFTDENLSNFDSMWKVMPPLRDETHRLALVEGVMDGTIDFICTNHTPWHVEAKQLEFPYAEPGVIGLETAFALCQTYLADVFSPEVLVEKWALAPRRILGIPQPQITEGAPAELALFAPYRDWMVQPSDIYSRSRNTPLLHQRLRGRPLGIISRGQVVWQNSALA